MLGIDYIDSNSKPLMLVGNVNILSVDDVTDDIPVLSVSCLRLLSPLSGSSHILSLMIKVWEPCLAIFEGGEGGVWSLSL